MKIKNSFKVYIGFILILFSISNLNATEKNYYQDIVNDWNKIFPDKNRNAAGPKFFKYILDKEITYKDFVEYNKLYCAVSGSLISPNSTPEFVYLKENITEKKICGEYYRCCIPCSCDLMKYSKTQKMKYKFTDIEKEFYVLTIDNPCGKKDFPIHVNNQLLIYYPKHLLETYQGYYHYKNNFYLLELENLFFHMDYQLLIHKILFQYQ